MSNSQLPKVRFLCLPDIDKPIGGVKQLYRHVEHLVALGWDAAVLTHEDGFRPSWFSSNAPTISLSNSFRNAELQPDRSIIVLPETYVNINLHSFYGIDLSSLARVVFNQNAYYSFGSLDSVSSEELNLFYLHPNNLHVLSVSEDTHDFLTLNFRIHDSRISRIINAIEPLFSYGSEKSNVMTWMPRKNPDHVKAVLLALQSSRPNHSTGWLGEPLQDLAHADVAKRLAASRLFLSFGHPDGFGLPIAEAMISGCWVVGYSGGGGRELFRYGASTEVNFGDWSGFVGAIHNALRNFSLHPIETELKLARQSLAVSSLYSHQQERLSIASAWSRIELAFKFTQ